MISPPVWVDCSSLIEQFLQALKKVQNKFLNHFKKKLLFGENANVGIFAK
jgi:hypothetical protein